MGKEKAFLPYCNETSFLEHLLITYMSFPDMNVYLIANAQNIVAIRKVCSNKPVMILKNNNPERGRLHSILLGLEQIDATHGVFIQNIDNCPVK